MFLSSLVPRLDTLFEHCQMLLACHRLLRSCYSADAVFSLPPASIALAMRGGIGYALVRAGGIRAIPSLHKAHACNQQAAEGQAQNGITETRAKASRLLSKKNYGVLLARTPSTFKQYWSGEDPMTLTEARSLSRLAGAERSAGGITVLLHRRSPRYHLTRYTPGEAGRSQPQRWVFPNLYDLLVFARTQGFVEVDAEASDWRAVSG